MGSEETDICASYDQYFKESMDQRARKAQGKGGPDSWGAEDSQGEGILSQAVPGEFKTLKSGH